MGRRNDEMKFAYAGPFASRKGMGRKLGTAFAKPTRNAAGHLSPSRYTPTSPERYTIQTALAPATVTAVVAAFGRSAK